MSETCLIWSNEHRAWWRANSRGYTPAVKDAGRYDHDDAIAICAGARDGWSAHSIPSEIPVRLDDVRTCEKRWDELMSNTA